MMFRQAEQIDKWVIMDAGTGQRLAGLRLLLVEDNFLNQQVACEIGRAHV